MTAIIDFQRIMNGRPLLDGQAAVSAFGEDPLASAPIPIFSDIGLTERIMPMQGGRYRLNQHGDITDATTGLTYQTAYTPAGYSLQLLDKDGIEIFQPFRQIQDPDVLALPDSVGVSVVAGEVLTLDKTTIPEITDNAILFVSVIEPEGYMPGDPLDYILELTELGNTEFADGAEIAVVNFNTINGFIMESSGALITTDGTSKVFLNKNRVNSCGILDETNSQFKLKKIDGGSEGGVWYASGELDIIGGGPGGETYPEFIDILDDGDFTLPIFPQRRHTIVLAGDAFSTIECLIPDPTLLLDGTIIDLYNLNTGTIDLRPDAGVLVSGIFYPGTKLPTPSQPNGTKVCRFVKYVFEGSPAWLCSGDLVFIPPD